MILRNKIAQTRAGGPRQFAELRDKLIIKTRRQEQLDNVISELDRVGFQGDKFTNAPVIVAEPRGKIEDSLDRITQTFEDNPRIQQGIQEIQDARDSGREILSSNRPVREATDQLTSFVQQIDDVSFIDFVITKVDFGPANLSVFPERLDSLTPDEALEQGKTLEDLNKLNNLDQAWEKTRGSGAIACIFDTGFAEGLVDSSRIVEKIHHKSVDTVFAPEEGHGTMCLGAMAANNDKSGVPFNGAAPESDVILVRVTDDNGQIRSDAISEGYDRLMGLDVNKPIIANHSYGTPLCSGRPRQRFCSGAEQDMVRVANSTSDITSVYAAGNEATYCGHRPSGITNGITGTNSLEDVFTVGALLFNMNEAQTYSSHGRGDCAPVADPKPNISEPLPSRMYYGSEDGFKIKDMSKGFFGSSGGTSHASPTFAGKLTLVQSFINENGGGVRGMSRRRNAGEGGAETEELKQMVIKNSKPPRPTQINRFGLFFSQKGYDSRFGNGHFKVNRLLNRLSGS